MSLSKAGLVSPIPVTLAQRDAITDKQPGYIVFNSDAQEAEMWTGTEWIILGNRPGTLNYRGGIDMTTSAPTYQPPENGDMYLNEKEGVVTAGWENLTGLGVLPNDRVVFDGTNWALITSGGGIPNLQVVTDAGDTTTHTITTAGYITAGNVQATDGLFSGERRHRVVARPQTSRYSFWSISRIPSIKTLAYLICCPNSWILIFT